MPREWIAELAGESAIVPTYRTGQLRLAGPIAQVAPATPAPAAPATPAPADANPRGLVTGPKSVQASVKTQVDLVLQLVQVFAV